MMPIRVLQILSGLRLGGAEFMVVHLAQALDRERFEVEVASIYAPFPTSPALEQQLAAAGIPLVYLGKKKAGVNVRLYPRLHRLLRDFRPDVVHTHQTTLQYVYPVAQAHRIPVQVNTVHNLAQKEGGRGGGRLIRRIAFRFGVTPVAIAERCQQSITEVYGIGEMPMIPNGIPVNNYQLGAETRSSWRQQTGFAESDVLFVCVAGLHHQKNQALLLRAFAEIAPIYPQARLALIGDGAQRAELEALAAELRLGEQVRFLGWRTDVAQALAAADGFVLVSHWEGNPLSVMEAMAAGRPVIATRVGGVPELIEDHVSGFLISPQDQAALVQKLRHLIEHPDERERVGRAALACARARFDAPIMGRDYGTLYESLLWQKRRNDR